MNESISFSHNITGVSESCCSMNLWYPIFSCNLIESLIRIGTRCRTIDLSNISINCSTAAIGPFSGHWWGWVEFSKNGHSPFPIGGLVIYRGFDRSDLKIGYYSRQSSKTVWLIVYYIFWDAQSNGDIGKSWTGQPRALWTILSGGFLPKYDQINHLNMSIFMVIAPF